MKVGQTDKQAWTKIKGMRKVVVDKHACWNWADISKQNKNSWHDEFQSICWYAGFDPEVIHDCYKKLIKENKIVFTKTQKSWIEYRDLYKQYRAAKNSAERRSIMLKIVKVNLGRNSSWAESSHGGLICFTPGGKFWEHKMIKPPGAFTKSCKLNNT